MIEERDIIKIILGICLALLLGLASWFNFNIITQNQKWIMIGLLSYVLYSVWYKKI